MFCILGAVYWLIIDQKTSNGCVKPKTLISDSDSKDWTVCSMLADISTVKHHLTLPFMLTRITCKLLKCKRPNLMAIGCRLVGRASATDSCASQGSSFAICLDTRLLSCQRPHNVKCNNSCHYFSCCNSSCLQHFKACQDCLNRQDCLLVHRPIGYW